MDEKTLKEAFASLVKTGDMSAIAALLVEYVDPQHVTADIVGLLLNARSLGPNDALVKKVRKGIKVRTLVPGRIHLASEITVSDRINFALDGLDVKVHAKTFPQRLAWC